MYRSSVLALVLLFLYIISISTCAFGCASEGLGNCDFDGTLCGWSLGGNFTHISTAGGHIHLEREAENGSLTSKEVCFTDGEMHCFKFSYRFEAMSTTYLSVSINFNDNNELLLWRLSGENFDVWRLAIVPITANDSFRLVLRAETLLGQNASKYSVDIDTIFYNKSTSPCTLQPSHASPTYVATTPESEITTKASPETVSSGQTVTGTTPEQTSLIQTSVSTISHSRTNTEMSVESTSSLSKITSQQTTTSSAGHSESHPTFIATDNSATPTSEDENDRGIESSNKIRIIVGVVVGVIVIVIIIIVLLLLLCRRRRRKAWKANNAQENSYGRHPSSTAPSMQPPNHYEINRNPNDPQSSPESAMPEYAVVNKPRKVRQDNPSQSPYEMNDEDTAQLSAQHSEPPQEAGSTSKNSHYSLARNLGPRVVHNSLYDVPPGGPAAFSPDQAEDYNMLDFQGKSLAAQNTRVLAEEEEAGNAVYNRLNDGGDDTYNEVDRQRKAEVLGDEYSHISHL